MQWKKQISLKENHKQLEGTQAPTSATTKAAAVW